MNRNIHDAAFHQGLDFDDTTIQRLFGHEAAEDEDPSRLKEYYFKNKVYKRVVTDLPLRLLVGHKGIGKSALFQIAMQEDAEDNRLSILIKPDDIADINSTETEFFKSIRDWKAGLIEIIAKNVMNKFVSDDDDWKGLTAKYGIKIIDFFKDYFKKNKNISFSSSDRLIIDKFLESQKVYIYLDDLDRGWQGRESGIKRVSALLNAVRDLTKECRGLFFRIALRTDVYYLFRTSDESTDKIEGSVIWHSWSNQEIFLLLVKRIESFFSRPCDEEYLLRIHPTSLAQYLLPIFNERFKGSGKWNNAPMHRVLMSLIRKRPRDLVKLCTLIAKAAHDDNSNKLRTEHFQKSFEVYSQGRLQDTFNEYRSELPEIDRLLINMKPNKKERTAKAGYTYSTSELMNKIDKITQHGCFRFSNGKVASKNELAAFMYKINFLTARKEGPFGITRKYFEENQYLINKFSEFGFEWEIHPAYRWALQPDTQNNLTEIFNNVDLETSESITGCLNV